MFFLQKIAFVLFFCIWKKFYLLHQSHMLCHIKSGAAASTFRVFQAFAFFGTFVLALLLMNYPRGNLKVKANV